jgi:hypothetical protein
MTTIDFITELYCRIAERLTQADQEHKHCQAKLYPSEVVTLAVLYSLKGSGQRAFWRWLTRDYRPRFPQRPDRTRLFRLFNTQRALVDLFLAEASLLGVSDSYGIEWLHPRCEGRSEKQIGKKGKSNWRWIIGGKLCFVLNHLGLIVAWDCDAANVYDGAAFQHLVDSFQEKMLLFADTGFDKVDWQPTNLCLCHRGEWNVRMVVETLLSILTYVCHFKHMAHKSWEYFRSHLAYTMALFNLLAEWHGLLPDDSGFVHLSIADFSL